MVSIKANDSRHRRGYGALEGRQSPVRRWAFFSHPPLLARLSLNHLPISNLVSFYRQSWGSISYRRTYRLFLFHLFCFRELATRFLLLVPAPPPFLASAGTRPLPFSLFLPPPRSSVVVVVVPPRPRSTIRSTSPRHRRGQRQLFLSHLWSCYVG